MARIDYKGGNLESSFGYSTANLRRLTNECTDIAEPTVNLYAVLTRDYMFDHMTGGYRHRPNDVYQEDRLNYREVVLKKGAKLRFTKYMKDSRYFTFQLVDPENSYVFERDTLRMRGNFFHFTFREDRNQFAWVDPDNNPVTYFEGGTE